MAKRVDGINISSLTFDHENYLRKKKLNKL
jgi:hypothetical protein